MHFSHIIIVVSAGLNNQETIELISTRLLFKPLIMEKKNQFDVLIIGSGLAGLACALSLPSELKIAVVSKSRLENSNTQWAQGGIASVLDSKDHFDHHIQDTLDAGQDLCRANVVEQVIKAAPNCIALLESWGVNFDRLDNSTEIELAREGGHSHRRIAHVHDQTGKAIQEALLHQSKLRSNIQLFENYLLMDLITDKKISPHRVGSTQILGAYFLNLLNQKVEIWPAHQTVLATGGVGRLYLYTSNWAGATGDGIAAAFRAGARVANLEFMQFHPTALYHHQSRNFLVTEAIRGEGGELINQAGRAFMKKYHPMGSLAPRDIVARSIDSEMKASGSPCVFLDIRFKGEEFIKLRFPHIYQHCLSLGLDITKDPIPVVPAAHYLCGGILTEIDGRCDLHRLYIVGESACTGLHGANRLASNSLLECILMGNQCAQTIAHSFYPLAPANTDHLLINEWQYPSLGNHDEAAVLYHLWDEIRTLMWNYVGIVRTNKRLKRASERLNQIFLEVQSYYQSYHPNLEIIELRNLALVAKLTVQCAQKRKESRGIHYNLDYPNSIESEKKDSILWTGEWLNEKIES